MSTIPPGPVTANTRSGAGMTGPPSAPIAPSVSGGGGASGGSTSSSTCVSGPSSSSGSVPSGSGIIPTPVIVALATIIQTTVPFTAFHLESVTEADIKAWKINRELAVKKGVTLDKVSCISAPSLEMLTLQFIAHGIINAGDDFLSTMDDITFFQHLGKVFGDQSGSVGMTELEHPMSGIPKLRLNLIPGDPAYTEYFKQLSELCTKSGAIGKLSVPEEVLVCKKLQESLQHSDGNSKNAKTVIRFSKLLKEGLSNITTIEEYKKTLLS